MSITGGDINLAVGDDGITCAGDIDITGDADIDITTAYEGIEGANITVGTSGATSGPSVSINSNDDGVNASSKTLLYTYDSEDDEDSNFLKQKTSKSGNTFTVYSGDVTVKIDSENTKSVTLAGTTISYTAGGDGIDCNGTLDLEGGTTYVFGEYNKDNSPIDTDQGFTLGENATVLAAGSDRMGESTPEYGTGTYITYGSAGGSGMGGPGGDMGAGHKGLRSR